MTTRTELNRSEPGAFVSRLAVLLAMALLAGCTSPRPFDDFVEREIVTTSQPAMRSHAGAGGPASNDAAAGTMATFSDDATVDDYVRVALERNPSLRAARERIAIAQARVPQARSLEDPMLMVSPIGQMAETAAGEVGLMAGVSQTLPWPGKLDARADAAEADARVAEAELITTRLAIENRVRQAYWAYHLAARNVEEVRQSRGLLEQLQGVAEAAYRAGVAQQQDVLRASVERSTLENELLTLAQQQEAAAGQLNALMDRPVDAPLPPPAAVSPEMVEVRLDALLARAAADSPTLAAAREGIAAARDRLRASRLARIPDLTVGLQYNAVEDEGLSMAANGDDQWWLTFTLNLPIWSGKYDAMQAEARHAVLAELAELQATRNALAAEVQGGFVQVQTQQRLVRLFETTLLPQAQQALDASLASYRTGNLGFGEVIDNWQRLLEFRRMLHQSRAMLGQQVSELERTIGGALSPADEVNTNGTDETDE